MRMTEKEAIRLINAYLEIDYSRIPEMTVEKFDEAMTMTMETLLLYSSLMVMTKSSM